MQAWLAHLLNMCIALNSNKMSRPGIFSYNTPGRDDPFNLPRYHPH